ncbi:hypothetical protein B0T10DRAFT_500181 [Thelonectria olida]|uniref:Nephrocystin 3-like N-terminal domain-containing protein n=1 Tax=Thelonectria olida TaxID=1576542 RepID=A0A9P8VR50_9HYPO|nr:hypothetical protein B0T10DRAFT_500181 [Thelonectria olida]
MSAVEKRALAAHINEYGRWNIVWPRKRTKVDALKALNTVDRNENRCLWALFVTDASRDRDDIIQAKGEVCDGTCEWIISTEAFETWDQGPPHLLWISAPPGMGKTYMSIYLSRYFQRVVGEQPTNIVLFFFCDSKDEARNTSTTILRGLVYQLVSYQADLMSTIMPQWRADSHSLFDVNSLDILWRLFVEMLDKLKDRTVYCIIDAIDECEQSSLLSLLRNFEMLNKGPRTSTTKLKLVCLSRRNPERIPESLLSFRKIKMDMMAAGKEDVQRFISQRVLELAQKKGLGFGLRRHIEERFQEQCAGSFLWVSLMAQDLEKKGWKEIEASLEILPRGLDGFYERILSQIEPEKIAVVLKMLSWILVATRPLRVPELCEAIHVEGTEFSSREEVCLSLIQSCGPLLQITWNGVWWTPRVHDELEFEPEPDSDSETESESEREPEPGPESEPEQHSRNNEPLEKEDAGSKVLNYWSLEVTIGHQSAKDYLTKSNQIFGLKRHGNLAKQHLQVSFTNALIGYLSNIKSYRCGLPSWRSWVVTEVLTKHPLAHYAVYHWHLHFRELDEVSQIIQENGDFFGTGSKTRECWYRSWRSGCSDDDDAPMSLLHMACVLDLYNLANWCLEQRQMSGLELGSDLGRSWGRNWGRTPLHEACCWGWENIANLLLDAGADALAQDKQGSTSFEHALDECGQDLLQRMAATGRCGKWLREQADNKDSDILCRAARLGNEEACRFLVEDCGWDVNSQDALASAVWCGKLKLARTFVVEWHARVDDDWKLLEAACLFQNQRKFRHAMQLVVHDCSVDINAANGEGCNILCCLTNGNWFGGGGYWRELRGTTSRLEVAFQMGCDADLCNHQGRRPLHCAANTLFFPHWAASTETLELMLRYSQLDINNTCQEGRTVLHHFMAKTASLEMSDFAPDEPEFPRYLKVTPRALRRLLDLGVDRHLRDQHGHTALDLLRPALDRDMEFQRCRFDPFIAADVEYKGLVEKMVTLLESYASVPRVNGLSNAADLAA